MAIKRCNIFKAVAVRCILTCHVVLCVWRVVVDLDNQMYWLLLCSLVPLVCETFYTTIKRQGVEFSRFTACFFCYLGAVLPGIWLLELDKTDLYIEGKHHLLQQVANISGEHVLSAISLSPVTWIIVIEEMLPYVMFLSRWILPRGRVKREELAELLFAFIEIAADIMEFFSLFGEDVIRSNKTLAYIVLSIWSLAVLQFTMTFTIIHQPKKVRKVKAVQTEATIEKEWKRIKNECFAIFLTILMQDLPFAVMRLYTIINFSYINYSLIFFTSKNLIIISLLIYKMAALCKKRYCPDPDDDVGEDEAEQITDDEEIDGVEINQNKKDVKLENLKQVSINIEKRCVCLDEYCSQRSNTPEDFESGMKNNCYASEPDVSKIESSDSGIATPSGVSQSNIDTISSDAVLYKAIEDIAKHSYQLCARFLEFTENELIFESSNLDRDEVLQTSASTQDSENRSKNHFSKEGENFRHRLPKLCQLECTGNNIKYDFTEELKETEISDTNLEFSCLPSTVNKLLLSAISKQHLQHFNNKK